MPQLKKISVSRNNILPKLELSIDNVYTNYSGTQDITTYVPLFTDIKSCTLLTSEAESDAGDSLPCKPRKRQRLDHLSQEEKIMRRKMKNRVAAQTARDRKKARMTELEEQVIELETERKMLLMSNMNLQSKNEALEKENTELKLRLGEINIPKVKEEVSSPVKESESVGVVESRLSDSSWSLEHAEGTGPANSVTLDDAVHLFTSGCEDDAFLDILQQCTEDLFQPEDISISLSEFAGIGEIGEPELSASEVVGTPPKSMESHKELIHFDHIYYKQEGDASPLPAESSPLNCELSTKDCSSMDLSGPLDADCVIEVDSSSEIPVICISEPPLATERPPSDVLSFESLSYPHLGDEILSSTKPVPSPVSSDGGYDSSFSVSSPGSSAVNPWDDTLSELFPSLV